MIAKNKYSLRVELSPEDSRRLADLTRAREVSISALMRNLIRRAYSQLVREQGKEIK